MEVRVRARTGGEWDGGVARVCLVVSTKKRRVPDLYAGGLAASDELTLLERVLLPASVPAPSARFSRQRWICPRDDVR